VAVAAGTVASPSGAAAGGVPVDLYAWPSDAVLKAMKPGQMVPRTLLTAVTTNGSGQYTLSVPAATLKAAAVDNGYANLEIDSPAGIWFMAYQPGKAPAAATVNFPAAKKKGWPCGREPKRPPFDGGTYAQVGWWLVKNHPAADDVVGQAYITGGKKTAGDWVAFSYAQSQSASQTSTLGVGLSGYGLDAGYSTSGTHASTASAFQGFPTQTKNTLFATGFTSATYRADCIGPAYTTGVPRKKQYPKKDGCPLKYTAPSGIWFEVHMCLWKISSTGWFGGDAVSHPRSAWYTPAGDCAPELAGSKFGNDYGSAVEWANGFQLGATVGIKGVNLKSDFGTTTHTGYDKDAHLIYHFPKHTGWICGTNKRPTEAAILVARAHRA